VERFPAAMKSKYGENTGAVRYFFPTTSLATAKLGRLVRCEHSDWNRPIRRSELEFSSVQWSGYSAMGPLCVRIIIIIMVYFVLQPKR